MNNELLVIVRDRLTDLLQKGEIVDRYYNPGDLFSTVTILLLNDDQPDPQAVQRLVGSATLKMINCRPGILIRLPYLNTILYRKFVRKIIPLYSGDGPELIRVHGAGLQSLIGVALKYYFNCPVVVSLHINPDEDIHAKVSGIRARAESAALRCAEPYLHQADYVIAVYCAIIPYLERLGVAHHGVHYNVINSRIKLKSEFGVHPKCRLICVGRQFAHKNPANIICSLQLLPDAELTLIGDGPAHESLRRIAEEMKILERVTFLPALPNDDVCSMLADSDIFVYHSEYAELSKGVLEAMLAGLPVVHSKRSGPSVPELSLGLCSLVNDSPEEYAKAIQELIFNEDERIRIIRAQLDYAESHFLPEVAEQKVAELYLKLIADPEMGTK